MCSFKPRLLFRGGNNFTWVLLRRAHTPCFLGGHLSIGSLPSRSSTRYSSVNVRTTSTSIPNDNGDYEIIEESPPSDLQPEFSPSTPFPALPGIKSQRIETQVFTHRSFYGRPGHVFEDHPHDPSPDNEKYEHLGDSVLNMVVTHLLFETHPNLRVGPSTKIRSLVVGNNTLADISRRYGLPARLRLHPAQIITLRTSVHVQADVFESYIAGLFLDQGLFVVDVWLRALFIPYVREACIRVRSQHGLPPSPQVDLATAGVGPERGDSELTWQGTTANPTETSSTGVVDTSTTHMAPAISPGAPANSSPILTPTCAITTSCNFYRPPPSGFSTTTGHLALFNQLLNKAQIDCEWEYRNGHGEGTRTTPIWIATAKVGNEHYGTGQGGTKKAARNEAAKVGLIKLGVNV